jgi:hypothetical protein
LLVATRGGRISQPALDSRKARDEPSGRPTQNAAALVVIELSRVLKLTQPDPEVCAAVAFCNAWG